MGIYQYLIMDSNYIGYQEKNITYKIYLERKYILDKIKGNIKSLVIGKYTEAWQT